MSRIVKRTACEALDPRTLGRPVHLLHRYTEQLHKALAELLRNEFNRHYHADFQVCGIAIAPGEPGAGRWQAYAADTGVLAVAIERPLVLSALAYRYGIAEGHGQAAEPPPETATEERLHTRLGRQFAELAGLCVHRMRTSGEAPAAFALQPLPSNASPARGTWLVDIRLREGGHGVEGMLRIALDEGWMALLLRHLAPLREKQAMRAQEASLAGRLQLKLVGRLLEKDVLLEELLDLKVGSVIPVSLGATEVLIDKSRLFTAVVAEHGGKLCLTSFQDTE